MRLCIDLWPLLSTKYCTAFADKPEQAPTWGAWRFHRLSVVKAPRFTVSGPADWHAVCDTPPALALPSPPQPPRPVRQLLCAENLGFQTQQLSIPAMGVTICAVGFNGRQFKYHVSPLFLSWCRHTYLSSAASVSCVLSASLDHLVFFSRLSADLRCFFDSFGRSAAFCFTLRNGVQNFVALFAGFALCGMKSDPDDSSDSCDDGPTTCAAWIRFLRAPASFRLCSFANGCCAVVACSAAGTRLDCGTTALKRSGTLSWTG